MKTSGIRDLKAHLSSYVREVEQGESILVTDRGRVVAELRPPGVAGGVGVAGALRYDRRYDRLVARGVIHPASDEGSRDRRTWGSFRGLGARKGTARAILDADRGE